MIANIQALRALAATAVVVSHVLLVERKYGTPVFPDQAAFGAFGVDLFFVISGFIMVTIAKGSSAMSFLLARARRILPPYWVYTSIVLLIYLYVPAAVNSSFAHPPSIWRSYLLIPDDVGPLLAVGWTLEHEAYFYLCFALMLGLTRVLALPALLGVWAVSVLCLHGALDLYGIGSPIAAVLTHPLTLEFIFGAVVGLLIRRKVTGFGSFALLAGILALAVTLSFHDMADAFIIDRGWGRVTMIGGPCALIVYGAVALELRGALKAPRWLAALGDASYSTYLSHVLVISALGRLLAMTGHASLIEVGFVIACVVGANAFGVASFRLLESRTSYLRLPAFLQPSAAAAGRRPLAD